MATVAEPPRPTLLPWSEVKSDPRYEFAAPEQRKRLLDTWYSKQATQALQDPSLDPQSVLSLQFQRKFAEAELEDPTFAVDTSDSKRQELVQSYLQAQDRRVKQTTADTDFLVRKREGLVDKAAELSPRQSEALAWYEQSGLANTPDFQWATRRIGGELQVNPVLAAQGVEQYKEAILQSDASDTEKLDALASYNFLRQEAQADLAQTLRSREGVDRLFGSDLIEDDERELVSRNLFAAFITDEEVADYPKKGASAIRGLNPENREQVIDNVINEWLVDKGGHELAKRARKGDETARAQIYNLYRDAVISMPELWVDAEDVKDDFERVRQLSTGEFIMNPSWVAATPPDKLREELTRMKVPEDRVEGLVEQGDAIREVNASRTVAALLGAWYRDGDELKPYGNKFLQAVGQAGGQAGGFLGEALGVGAANFRAWFRRNGDQYDNDYDMLAAYKAQNKGVFATINNTIAKIERGIAAVPAQAAQIGGAIGTSIAGSGADFMETATGTMRDLKEASAAQGGVPFVDDIATELTWMAATAGAGGLLARGGARVGGTQAANQMLRNRAHRQLSQLAAQGNYGKGAELALRMLATSPEATGAALGRRFAGVGYFGIAGARSAGNVYSEGFSAHKERALAMGASEEVATEVARTNALIPALGAGAATMFLMKAVPGGLESFFKGSLDDVTFKALRERLGDDVVRQGFKNPEFKKAFVTVLGGGALREGGKEALEEGLDEGIQSLIAATTFDPDMTLGEAFENIIHGAILGGLLGSAVPLADSASRATGELRQTQAELLANAAANGAPETAAAVAEAVDSAAPAAVGSPATPPAASGAATPSTPPPTTPPTPTVAPTTLKEEPLPDTEEELNQQLVSVDAEIQTVRSQLEEVEESDPVSEAARRGRSELAKLEATKSEIESKLGNLVAAAAPDTAPPPGTTPAEDTIPGVAEGAAAPPPAPPAAPPAAAPAPEPVSGPTAPAPEPVSGPTAPAPEPVSGPPASDRSFFQTKWNFTDAEYNPQTGDFVVEILSSKTGKKVTVQVRPSSRGKGASWGIGVPNVVGTGYTFASIPSDESRAMAIHALGEKVVSDVERAYALNRNSPEEADALLEATLAEVKTQTTTTPPPAAAPATTNENATQTAPPSPAPASPEGRRETPRTEVQAPAAGGRGARQPGPAAGGAGQPERGMTRKRALEISNAPLRETYTRQEAEELLESANQAGRFFEGDALAGDSDARSKLDELGELRDTLTGLLAGTLTTEETGVTITEPQTTATNEQQPTPQPAGAEQPPAPAPTTPAPAGAAPGQPAATGDRDAAAGPGQADAGATGELRREVPSGRPQQIVVGGGNIPAPRSSVPFDEYSAVSGFNLSAEQQLGVRLMVDKFEAGGPGFLLGDGTGFGKTAQIVVAAHELAKRTGQPILVVTMSDEIIRTRFIPEMEALGIPANGLIELTTYSQVRSGKLKQSKYRAAFFDEAHSLKNSTSDQAKAVALINRDYSVYATATPMDKREAATYFISDILGMAEEDVAQELGLQPVYSTDAKGNEIRTWQFDSKRGMTHAEFLDRLKAFRDEAIMQGAYLRRDFPFWGTVSVNAEFTLSEDQKEEQADLVAAWDAHIEANSKKRFNLSGRKSQELKKWAELQKVQPIVTRVQQQLAQGKKVVVFAETYNKVDFSNIALGGPSVTQRDMDMGNAGMGKLLQKAFDEAGITHAAYLGEGNTKSKRDALKTFQVDGAVDVLITTPKSGGTGIDLDDQVGNAPRHIIMASPNFSGDVFDQIVGRVSRRNTKSPASVEVVAFADALGDVNSLRTMRKKVETLKAIQGGDQDKLDFGKLEETTRSEAEKSGGGKKKPSKPRLPSTFPTSGLNWVTEGDKSRVILSVADNPELDENARRQFWNYWEKHKDEARSRGVKPFKEVDPVTGEAGPWQLVVPTAFLEQLPGGPVARTPAPPAEPITEAEATASVSDEQRRTEAAQSQEGTPAAETPEVKTAPPGTGKGFFDELRERMFPESAAPKKDPKAEAKTRELKPSDVVRLINAGVSINGQQLRQLYRLSPAEAKAQAETINAGIARKYPSAPRPDNVVLITKKDGGPKHSNDYKVYRDKTTGEETPAFTNNSTETAKALSNGERMVVPEGVAVNPAILTQDGVVVGVKVPFNAEGEVRSPRPDPETTGEPDPADEAVVVGAPGSGRPTYADVFAKFTGSMSEAQRARGARAEATGENLGKNLHLDSLAAPYPPELAAQFGILPDANGRTADPEAVAMQVMNEMFPKAASKAVYKNIPPSERDRAQVTATMELFDWMRNANTHRRFAEFRATVSQDNTLSKEEQDARFVELVKGNFPPGLKDYLIPLKRGDLPKAKTFEGKILAFEAYLNDKVLANFFEHSITNRAAFLAGQQLNNKLKGGTQQKGLSVVAQGFAAEEDVQRQVVEDAPAGDQNVRVVEQATPEQERREQAAFTLRRHNYKGKGNLADPASLTEEELGLAEIYRSFQAFAEAHAAELGRMAPGPIDAEQIERILTSPSETAQLFWDRLEAPETLPLYEEFLEKLDASYAKNIDALNVPDAVTQQIEQDNFFEANRLGLRSNDPESVRRALSVIATGRGFSPELRTAARLLLTADVDLDNVEFRFFSNPSEDYAGRFSPPGAATAGPNGRAAIDINFSKRGGRGVADTLVHEMVHFTLDALIADPQTDVQRQLVHELERIRIRAGAAFETANANFDGFLELWHGVILDEVGSKTDGQVLYEIARSKSPLAKAYKPGMSQDEQRALLFDIKREEYGATEAFNRHEDLRYALLDDEGRSHGYAAKEFVAHLMTDPKLGSFLRRIGETYTKKGGRKYQIFKGPAWQLTMRNFAGMLLGQRGSVGQDYSTALSAVLNLAGTVNAYPNVSEKKALSERFFLIAEGLGRSEAPLQIPRLTPGAKRMQAAQAFFGTAERLGRDRGVQQARAQQDRDYLSAVERGDMATAQRMVDAAARAAGYTVRVFHGTVEDRPSRLYKSFEAGEGIFTTDNPDVAHIFRFEREYGEVITEVYNEETDDYEDVEPGALLNLFVKPGRQLDLSKTDIDPQEFVFDTGLQTRTLKKAIADGYDSVLVPNVEEGVGDWMETGTTTVLFRPESLKSADPVTRDAAGNVIPLSQRFDATSDSIQHSRSYDNTFLPKDFRTGKFTTVPGSREADPDRLEEIRASLVRRRIAEARGYSLLAQGGGDAIPALPVFDLTEFGSKRPSESFITGVSTETSFDDMMWDPDGPMFGDGANELHFVGQGSESIALRDNRNAGIIWKFLPRQINQQGGWGIEFPMGPDAIFEFQLATSQSAVFDKIAILNRLGTPTEAVGVIKGFDALIMKQAQLDVTTGLDAMAPLDDLGVDTNGVHLVEAPEELLLAFNPFGANNPDYIVYIDGDFYIVGDIRGANVGVDADNNVRILDAVVSKITQNIIELDEFKDFFRAVREAQITEDKSRQEFSSSEPNQTRAANGSIGAYHEARSQQALQEARKLVGLGMSLVSPQRIAEGVAAVEAEGFGEYDGELGLNHFATKVAFDILKNPSTATSISEAVPTTLRQVVGDILLAAANVSGPTPTTGDGLSVARMRSRFREFRDGVDPDVAGAQNARASALRWKFADNPQMSFLGENPVDPALYGGLGGTFGKDFRRWLTKEGKWGKEVFPIYIERQSAWKRTSLAAELREKELRGAIQRAAKAGKPVDITVLNKALGATANPLHPDVQKAAKKSFRDAHGVIWSTYMQRLQRAKALERRGSVTAGKRLRRRAQDVYQGRAERARVVYQNELQQAYDAGAQQFRVEQAQAQGQLFNTHPEVYKLVKDLRQQIDSLSMNISHIAEEKEVKAIILGNLGVYLRRTFEWWDKNDYREWLKTADPEAVKVAEKAKQYFGNRLALQKAESIRNAAAVSGVSMPFDQALQQARQQIPEDEIIKELETWVHELGNRAPDARAGFLTKEIFLEKQNIPPELLEFLGVYEDNIFNAIRTLSSLSEHHLNYKFLESVKDQLQDIQNQLNAGVTDPKDLQVLITDDKNTARKKGLRPFVPDVQNRLIASDAYGPLAGFYGPDLIVSAVHEMKPVDLSSLSRWGQKAVGYSMAAKTVYSFRTHVRNFLGNQMFLLYSGQAGLVDPRNWGDFRESWMLTMAQNARSAGERRKFLEELAEIGVTQDNVELNLINDLADAATLGPQAFARVMTPTIEGFAKKGVRKIKALGKLAGDYYAAEDDFWKILVYMNETRRHAIALGLTNPGDPNSLTDAQADRILTLFPPRTPSVKQIKDKKERAVAAFKRGMAYKSRAVTPHYTATFDFIRQAKRHGVTTFVAPFVSFQAEVVRLTGANWALVKQEAAIPEFRKIAAQRAGGALTAMVFGATILKGAAAGAAFLWKAMTGGGDDDDELEDITYADTMFNDQLEADMRRFLPSYYKWNDIAVIGRTKTGDYKWLDISWMNPFSVLKNPLNALVKNDDDRGILAAAQDALLTFVDPYTSPQIWLSALFEKTISDEREAALQEFDRAPLVTGAQGVLEIALKLGVPQTFIDLKKIWDSVGKDIERGREVSTTAEVGSFLLGTKVNSLDPARQLERITLPSRREQLTLMGDTFNRQFRRESEITADAMREAYLEAQEGRRRVLEATRRDVLAVGRLMGDGRQAIQILTDSRLGNTEEASVLMGVYRKWTPSDTTIERAAAAQRVVGDTRMQDYLKYREEVQEFSPLEEPLR